ncbi:hypothetical protein, partial [Klebsiella pneumoniae]
IASLLTTDYVVFRAHFLKKYKKRISILTKSEINCIKLPLLILLSKSAFAIGLKECKWNLFRILVTTVARISTAAGQ